MYSGQRVRGLNTETVVIEAAKSAPPIAVSLASFLGNLSLNNIIGVATLVYIVLQAAHLVWKWRRDIRKERDRNEINS